MSSTHTRSEALFRREQSRAPVAFMIMKNDELETIWMEVVVTETSYFPDFQLEGLRNTVKTRRQDNGAPVEIRTEHLSNMSLDSYRLL
jgi:hypothetical protein